MKFYYPKDKNGNRIGFKTPESQVYDTNGRSLTDKLTELNSNISSLNNNFYSDITFGGKQSVCMSKYLAILKNNSLSGLISIFDFVGFSPILNLNGVSIGNVVMSLGDIRFTITRISIDDNPDTSNRALCIEWSADGVNYKSYIDVNYTISV